MERLTRLLILCAGLTFSCGSADREAYEAWDPAFSNTPPRFAQAVTALWVSSYQEDPQTRRFVRTSAWGEVPEKLVPDGEGGYTAVVPLLLQSETSDGPQSDRFWTVLVRIVQAQGRFTLVPNEALPGEVVGWHDAGRRTVWFRGRAGASPEGLTLWQFQGRY